MLTDFRELMAAANQYPGDVEWTSERRSELVRSVGKAERLTVTRDRVSRTALPPRSVPE